MQKGKLFLLDGMALIYRAFFAFIQNPRITSSGLNASAMMGFTNTLLEILRKQQPTHIAVVFDTSAPTMRHIKFEAYKAQREAMPEDLRKSIPYIFRIIEGFNIPVITMDGYEADDIIGTLAWKAGDLGFDVFMMTPDKDFGQLVRENVKIYKPGRMGNGDEILGVAEILKRWEIQDPQQVIDILGLWGDASDNIPGVPGVGEKTAKKLIQEFGSMESILENTDKLKGKLQENMRLYVEQAKISKWLATIDTQVPVELDIRGLELEPVNEPVLREVFEELEFRTLMRRVLGESSSSATSDLHSTSSGEFMGVETTPAANLGTDLFGNPMRPAAPKKVKPVNPNQTSLFGMEATLPLEELDGDSELEESVIYKTIADVSHSYRIANSIETIAELLLELENAEAFCFDTETTDVESLHASLVGLSFSTASFTGWYVPVSEDRLEAMALLEKFRAILGSSKLKIAQNIKYDISVMENYGVSVALPMFDTMLAHYLLEPDQRHNMQLLSEKFLHYSPIPIEMLIGKKGKGQGSMKDVELEAIAEYATEDADITFQLYEALKPALKKKDY